MTEAEIRALPITDGYAHDLILEAHNLTIGDYPDCTKLIYVELLHCPGISLNTEDGVVMYDPVIIKSISMLQLCEIMAIVMHQYTIDIIEINEFVPAGTTFH